MCKFCGKTLKKAESMRTHELTHTGERPEMCPYCTYTCTSKSLLKKHVRSLHEHSNEEICELCGKSFNTKEKLRRHIGKIWTDRRRNFQILTLLLTEHNATNYRPNMHFHFVIFFFFCEKIHIIKTAF